MKTKKGRSRETGALDKTRARLSLIDLKATGANWVSIYAIVYQQNILSTAISAPEAASDANLVYTIQEAHRLGLKAMVKPHVDLSDDPNHWRG